MEKAAAIQNCATHAATWLLDGRARTATNRLKASIARENNTREKRDARKNGTESWESRLGGCKNTIHSQRSALLSEVGMSIQPPVGWKPDARVSTGCRSEEVVERQEQNALLLNGSPLASSQCPLSRSLRARLCSICLSCRVPR